METTSFQHPWDRHENLLDKAREHYDNKQYTDALELLTQAAESGQTSEIHFNKGLILQSLDLHEQAITEFEQSLTFNNEDVGALSCLARSHAKIENYDAALNIYEQIEEIDPEYEKIYCDRVTIYAQMNEYEKAEEIYYLARQIEEECPNCDYNIGGALFAEKKYDRAINQWEAVLKNNPLFPEVNYRIAHAYWLTGNVDKAEEHLKEEIRTDLKNLKAWYDMALLGFEVGDKELTEFSLKSVLLQDENHANAYKLYGILHQSQNNIQESLEDFRKARSIDGNIKGIDFWIAKSLALLGQKQEAEAHLEAALEDAEKNSTPTTMLSIGNLAYNIGETELAIKAFHTASVKFPAHVQELSHNLACCYFSEGNFWDGLPYLHGAMLYKSPSKPVHNNTKELDTYLNSWSRRNKGSDPDEDFFSKKTPFIKKKLKLIEADIDLHEHEDSLVSLVHRNKDSMVFPPGISRKEPWRD